MLDRGRLQRLYRYGYSLTRDEHSAYDLLQDAVEAALRKSPHDPQAMLRYVRTIMRNRFIDEYRREQRHPTLSLDEQDDCPVDIDPRVLEEVVIAQHDLDVAIAVLGPMERELLFLWAVEGYTAQELADQTGVPRGTVLARLHRLRSKIVRHVGSDVRAVGEGGGQ
ncbi:MAG: sigma-70 family RNA polymerase sigma factor [Betaproteobacteria bacterium]|jgi:RNA polymerase sigma-70 factor (ECF subfamily)|nr:MAG: sigma-70 family RNA polymerase sigma factor [Betaproteobacteria bacterium]